MGVLEDFIKMLDRLPLWKRLGEVPAEVDDLKARIADLETKLGGKWPADVCPYCGARTARLMTQRGPDAKGIITDIWLCGECKQTEHRQVKPVSR